MKQVPPMQFFGHLKWIDGRPLTSVIEPYRAKIFTEALYTFEDGRPQYNWVLCGRGKKNWKSADLVLAMFYSFFAWKSPGGNDSFLLANDEGQAADDLQLANKIIDVNPILKSEVTQLKKEIVRRDGKGIAKILPAKDVAGSHGKTYKFIGFDEIHPYKNWDIFEALAPDPTRHDAMTWVTTYASLYHAPGYPLFDLLRQAKKGDDPRFYFSWYASDYVTDSTLENKTPEEKANPSMESWDNPGYLPQQKKRLPTGKYRRLHLNLSGMPQGAAFDLVKVMDSIIEGLTVISRQEDIWYTAFTDISGGSRDDGAFALAHYDKTRKKYVLDLVVTQTGKPPFNPRKAVEKFAKICKVYGVSKVIGDSYGGLTFRQDFESHGINYIVCKKTKSELYEDLEPKINAGEVELLDIPKLQEQILGLTVRGTKIDHVPGEHDDVINAAAGAIVMAGKKKREISTTMRFSYPKEPFPGLAGEVVIHGDPERY